MHAQFRALELEDVLEHVEAQDHVKRLHDAIVRTSTSSWPYSGTTSD